MKKFFVKGTYRDCRKNKGNKPGLYGMHNRAITGNGNNLIRVPFIRPIPKHLHTFIYTYSDFSCLDSLCLADC